MNGWKQTAVTLCSFWIEIRLSAVAVSDLLSYSGRSPSISAVAFEDHKIRIDMFLAANRRWVPAVCPGQVGTETTRTAMRQMNSMNK